MEQNLVLWNCTIHFFISPLF